jgi:cytochrome P450 family 110
MGNLPPGPRSSIGSLVRYFRDPIGCMQPLTQEYGDTFLFPGNPALVMTGDPAGIKAIYTADPDTFEPLNQDLGIFVGPRSVILASGANHKRARKLMMPPFHGARMRSYGEQMIHLATEIGKKFEVGQTVTTSDTLQGLSLDVILQVVFGVTERASMEALGRLLLEITNGISPLLALFPALRREFGGMGPYARFLERRRRLHAALDDLIAKGKAAGAREDILSLLLAARTEDGQPMDDEEIRDQLILLVVAGHETTAIAMAWALYALHRPENAAVLGRLRDELSALGPDPEPEKLAKLPYLEAVCNETHRRYPLAPAPSPRKLLRPLEVVGYNLPVGTGVAAAISVAHFREEVYPEPMQFKPERFLDRTYSPFEFLPFGGGARRCLGAAMASYEMKLVLGTWIRNHRFRLASLKPDKGAVRLANAGPRHGVKLVVEA